MTDIQVFYDGPIVNRAEAKSNGGKKYFTGMPCKRGHVAQRWASTCMCCECLKVASRDKYWSDPDAARIKSRGKYNPEYASKYYTENKDAIMKRNAKWLRENADKKKEIDEKYRAENKEKIRAANAKWASENQDARLASWRNRDAMVRNAEGTHTAEDVRAIYDRQGGECVYCGADLSKGYHVDHIMPLILGGSNAPENLQCLCPTCNLRKGPKHPDDWHKEIGFG